MFIEHSNTCHIFGFVSHCFSSYLFAGVVGLFTLPKVYETNKVAIDEKVGLVSGKINEVVAK